MENLQTDTLSDVQLIQNDHQKLYLYISLLIWYIYVQTVVSHFYIFHSTISINQIIKFNQHPKIYTRLQQADI